MSVGGTGPDPRQVPGGTAVRAAGGAVGPGASRLPSDSPDAGKPRTSEPSGASSGDKADRTTPGRSAARFLRGGGAQKLLAFASLVALMIGFSLASPNFFQTSNVIAILQATSVNGILAVAATLVIITGGIDLSVGTMMTFCSVIAGVVLTYAGLPLPLGVLAAIAAGALCGLTSGTFVAKLSIPPFIATLGMMLMLKGLSLVISGTRPIYFNDTPGFTEISRGSLVGDLFPALPVPNGVLILFVVAGTTAWILSRTALGRYCFALGSNEEAVRLSGVNVDAWKMGIYALAGAIVGVGGLVIASRASTRHNPRSGSVTSSRRSPPSSSAARRSRAGAAPSSAR